MSTKISVDNGGDGGCGDELRGQRQEQGVRLLMVTMVTKSHGKEVLMVVVIVKEDEKRC